MLLRRSVGRMVVGVLLAIFGSLWTLQGLDVFRQDGGMNGRQEWTVIGAVTLAARLVLAASGYRARSRP